MDALILSCGTGGGHNAAAKALKEEFQRRGDRAVVLNPYTLCGKRMAGIIDRIYIRLVQKSPDAFGAIYQLGELYRRLPFRSPVYFLNKRAAMYMEEYLAHEHFDIILVTHLFPGEILTWLKKRGVIIPPVIYVATDYTCIPFTEETDCDAYVIPAKELTEDFVNRGIPKERIYPLGIPVQASFRKPMTRAEAKEKLGLEADRNYLLLSGGSMGAGKLSSMVKRLRRLCGSKVQFIVICGSNQKLYKKLKRKYADEIILLQSTEKMAEYIRASRIYFTKPGGLSSTEAAVMGTTLVHLPPIPGCETKNARFFMEQGMGIGIKNSKEELQKAVSLCASRENRQHMRCRQKGVISADAAGAICSLADEVKRLCV